MKLSLRPVLGLDGSRRVGMVGRRGVGNSPAKGRRQKDATIHGSLVSEFDVATKRHLLRSRVLMVQKDILVM